MITSHFRKGLYHLHSICLYICIDCDHIALVQRLSSPALGLFIHVYHVRKNPMFLFLQINTSTHRIEDWWSRPRSPALDLIDWFIHVYHLLTLLVFGSIDTYMNKCTNQRPLSPALCVGIVQGLHSTLQHTCDPIKGLYHLKSKASITCDQRPLSPCDRGHLYHAGDRGLWSQVIEAFDLCICSYISHYNIAHYNIAGDRGLWFVHSIWLIWLYICIKWYISIKSFWTHQIKGWWSRPRSPALNLIGLFVYLHYLIISFFFFMDEFLNQSNRGLVIEGCLWYIYIVWFFLLLLFHR